MAQAPWLSMDPTETSFADQVPHVPSNLFEAAGGRPPGQEEREDAHEGRGRTKRRSQGLPPWSGTGLEDQAGGHARPHWTTTGGREQDRGDDRDDHRGPAGNAVSVGGKEALGAQVLRQLDMSHFRDCLKRSYLDGPGASITHAQTTVEEARRQNLARQAEGVQRTKELFLKPEPFSGWSDKARHAFESNVFAPESDPQDAMAIDGDRVVDEYKEMKQFLMEGKKIFTPCLLVPCRTLRRWRSRLTVSWWTTPIPSSSWQWWQRSATSIEAAWKSLEAGMGQVQPTGMGEEDEEASGAYGPREADSPFGRVDMAVQTMHPLGEGPGGASQAVLVPPNPDLVSFMCMATVGLWRSSMASGVRCLWLWSPPSEAKDWLWRSTSPHCSRRTKKWCSSWMPTTWAAPKVPWSGPLGRAECMEADVPTHGGWSQFEERLQNHAGESTGPVRSMTGSSSSNCGRQENPRAKAKVRARESPNQGSTRVSTKTTHAPSNSHQGEGGRPNGWHHSPDKRSNKGKPWTLLGPGAYSPQGTASGSGDPTNDELGIAQTEGIQVLVPQRQTNHFPGQHLLPIYRRPHLIFPVRHRPLQRSRAPPSTTKELKVETFPWIASVLERLQERLLWESSCPSLDFAVPGPGQLLLYVGLSDEHSLDSILTSRHKTVRTPPPCLWRSEVIRARCVTGATLQSTLQPRLEWGTPGCGQWPQLQNMEHFKMVIEGQELQCLWEAVRNRIAAWGFPSLQPSEQEDTDNDSLLLLRLMVIVDIIHQRYAGPGLPWCFLEHPEDPKEP